MNARTLINLDDLAKFLIADRFSQNVRKINIDKLSVLSKDISKYDVTMLFSKFEKNADVEWLLTQLENIVLDLNLLYYLSIPYKKWMRNYCKLYLMFFHPDSTVKLENCSRYSKENFSGVKVIAAEDIPANTVMKNIFGYFKPLSCEEEKILMLLNKDFSILNNSRTNKQNIFLGTVAFVNHDCHPNTEYTAAERHLVYLRSLRDIKKNEELLVTYGDNYFGIGNESCECLTCSVKELFKENSISKTVDVPGHQFLEEQVNSLDDVIIGPGVLCYYSKSINNASEGLNDYVEGFRGFSKYTKLDIKLNRAYVKLEKIDEKLIQLYQTRTKDGSGFCIYCEDFKVQFVRHLRSFHYDQDIVRKFLNHDDLQHRNAAIAFLRHQGYAHYTHMTGIIIPVMSIRKDAKHKVEKVECSNCYAFFSKKTLWNHIKLCRKFSISIIRNTL